MMLLFGLFTRFAAISLIVITAVAASAVHWPANWSSLTELWQGYQITAKGSYGNFKLALLFIVLLLPLVFHGGGKLSLDHLLLIITGRHAGVDDRVGDANAAALALLVLGVSTVFLELTWGLSLIALAFITAIVPRLLR
jgi:putative oxidoreductase